MGWCRWWLENTGWVLCMMFSPLFISLSTGTPMIPVHVGIVSPTPAVSSTSTDASQLQYIIGWHKSEAVCRESFWNVLNWSVLVHKASNDLSNMATGSGPDHHLSATKASDSKERIQWHQSKGWRRCCRSNYHCVCRKHLREGGRHVDPPASSGEFITRL